ncbi:MAG: hypothetical protein LLG14_23185 [Nocardiaceae bacterium]|nr:hypothetical protein [Nocardiaceae bacterium]
MAEILAGVGVVVMLAFMAVAALVVKFAYIVVPIAIAWFFVAMVPSRTWEQFRNSFRTPAPIRVRSRR